MTAEAQRIAIAEACGWKWLRHPDVLAATKTYTLPDKWVMNPGGVLVFPHDAPDYCSDLNAMYEAEKLLTEEQRKTFALQWLPCVLCINGRDVRPKAQEFTFVHATAAQRAEALLRTLGKWEDDK